MPCQTFSGLGEWWLHKGGLNLQTIISMLKLCLGFLVDTFLFYVKWLARLNIFIHADILVLVSVVAILSEQWLLPTASDYCGHILQYCVYSIREGCVL